MIVKGHRLLTFGKILFYSYKWEKEDLLKKKKKLHPFLKTNKKELNYTSVLTQTGLSHFFKGYCD